jgi:hypothetical protein
LIDILKLDESGLTVIGISNIILGNFLVTTGALQNAVYKLGYCQRIVRLVSTMPFLCNLL